ncbi:MAG TPA: nitrogenase-stabilizing/protective protein NifW [Gammaproteobacteria bacterium]
MSNCEWLEELDELESAEDFLDYFEIAYERSVVQINRLHILQRFSNYLKQSQDQGRDFYRAALQRAYDDFVSSSAQTEKVFKVFRLGEPQEVAIPIERFITRSIPS